MTSTSIGGEKQPFTSNQGRHVYKERWKDEACEKR